MDEELFPHCANCDTKVCRTAEPMKGPESCPTKIEAEIIAAARSLYNDPELAHFAHEASIVEGLGYIKVPWAPNSRSPGITRLEEIMIFSRKMGYHRLGLAFCAGVSNEARTLVGILESKGFEVVSVCCKHGGIPKEEIGIKDSEKTRPGHWENMCNPISQAMVLNKEKTDFNILMGLCVGHDSLFLKHVEGLTTVFAVKDRVLAHNPMAALYQSSAYYNRIKEFKP